MVIINQVADDKAGPYTPEQAARAAGEFATSALRYTIQVGSYAPKISLSVLTNTAN